MLWSKILRSRWWRFEPETLSCYEWTSKRATLRCEECRSEATAKKTRRWRAYLTVVEEGKLPEVVVYCPECAKREFGDDDLNGRIPTIPPGGLHQ
jgi:hypothetical protein